MTTYEARKPKPFSLRFYTPRYDVRDTIETRTYSWRTAKEETEEQSKQHIDDYYARVADEITAFNAGATKLKPKKGL